MEERFLIKKEEGSFLRKNKKEIRIINGKYILINEDGKFYSTASIDEARAFLL